MGRQVAGSFFLADYDPSMDEVIANYEPLQQYILGNIARAADERAAKDRLNNDEIDCICL